MSRELHSLPPLKVTAYFLHICQRDKEDFKQKVDFATEG